METSAFNESQPLYDAMELMPSQGSTCDTYRVKLYGKLHFLKRLKPQYANNIRYKEAFRKEFETGFRLEHPHLARYISFDGEGILMEYIDGVTLSELLANNPAYFSKKSQTDRLLCQLLDALRYLYSHQIVHLDLKPDNIMLTRINHDVKLIDLGCCLTDTFNDTQGRTDRFAAPEQLNGGEVDIRADLYAIGKIIELFPNHTIYNKVIAKCTAPDKEKRFQSTDELLNAIRPKRFFKSIYLLPVLLVIAISFAWLMNRKQTIPNPEMANDTIIRQTIIQTDTVVISNSVPEEPRQKITSSEDLMRQELNKAILKAYNATIATFNDSIFPPLVPSPTAGEAWEKATQSFNGQVMNIVDRLSEKYPQIPRATIDAEAQSQLQNHISSVFNKMRANHEK